MTCKGKKNYKDHHFSTHAQTMYLGKVMVCVHCKDEFVITYDGLISVEVNEEKGVVKET